MHIFHFKTKETVFHYCASEGNITVLREILANLHSGQIQLAVNKQASNGWSPLIVAASKGHTEIALVIGIIIQFYHMLLLIDPRGRRTVTAVLSVRPSPLFKILQNKPKFKRE